MKTKNNVIALDIDDCILPNDRSWFGETNDSLEILEINLKRLILIINKYDFEINIISSWTSNLNYIEETRSIEYKEHKVSGTYKPYYDYEKKVFNILSKYLNSNISGIANHGKYAKLNELVETYKKVVIIEDTDFSEYEEKYDNCIWCYTKGFLGGTIGYQIHSFMEENIKWNDKQQIKYLNKT